MKNINLRIPFIIVIFALSLLFLKNILHTEYILNNVHYINDLAFVSYNFKETLKNDEPPLWTPYFYSGHPLLAIPENYMFDLNFLFVYLSGNIYLAMNLALIFYLFLAGLGMYLLVCAFLNDEKAALVSAIIYMFNGFMHSFVIGGHINILEGYALIPFIFLFTHKALKSREWVFYSMLAGIFFALQIFSGSMILFFYTALIVFFYFIFNLVNKNFARILFKSILVGVVIATAMLSLAAVKLLPVLEFTGISSRAVNVSFKEFLGYPINFKDITNVAVTSIGFSGVSAAVGVIGAVFVVLGLLNYKKKLVIFSSLLIIFSLLFASGTFVADVMYKLPGFDKLRHVERSLVLFAFSCSVLASYGFVFFSEKLKKQPAYAKYETLFFAGILLLLLVENLFLQGFPSSTKVIKPDSIGVLNYISSDTSSFRTMNIAQKEIIGAAGYNYYAQKGISEAKGGGGIWVNDYVMFLSLAQQSLNSNMLGILNVKYLVSDSQITSANTSIIAKFNECKECAVWNAFGPYLYKNDLFLPRYYIVPNGILVMGESNLVKQLIYGIMLQNLEPKNTVIVEGAKINDYSIDFLKRFKIIFLAGGSLDQESIAKLKGYTEQGGIIVPDIFNGQKSISNEDVNSVMSRLKGNYKEIKTDARLHNKVSIKLNGDKGWLVASERFAYFPGWRATVNGKNTNMFKADNAITAVYLESDKGDLVFEYKPKSYARGKVISLIAFVAILIYSIFFTFKKLKHGDKNQA